APGFPLARALDDFARPDAPLASPWVGNLNGLAVRNHALVQNAATNYAIWNGASLGPNQEAFMRFDSLDANAVGHNLHLKVQGTTWTTGAIQVTYDVKGSVIVVNTYTPNVGWTRYAGPWRGIRFVAGDTLGARAYSNGVV